MKLIAKNNTAYLLLTTHWHGLLHSTSAKIQTSIGYVPEKASAAAGHGTHKIQSGTIWDLHLVLA